MKKINSQSGNAHIVIIVVLVVALVATLGFVYWQNFIQKKDDSAKTSTQTSQKAATPKATAVLPDMIEYPTSVMVKSAVETAQLTNAPTSFKDFVVQTINADNIAIVSEGSSCKRVIYVDKIYKQTYALGMIGATSATGDENGCIGGAAILWGIVDGSWMKISGTQDTGFPCQDLEKYKVPSAIAGATCLDGTENGKAYSQS